MENQFVAIGSGKGGVGKSTTTINIALSLVATGMRVAIADLDPLSNITTILDIAADPVDKDGMIAPDATLSDITLPYIERCDILFANTKSITVSTKQIVEMMFGRLHKTLCARYDIVLIDMPAGIANEFFIDLIPHVRHVIAVVVPEPPSHISAAGFVKAIMQIKPDTAIYFWHNKFQTTNIVQFNAYTVIDNYHRYVDSANHFSAAERARCQDIAYVPHEQILDLLHSSLQPYECVWFKIRGVLAFFYELQIKSLVDSLACSAVMQEYLVHYLLEHRGHDDAVRYVRDLTATLDSLRESGIMPATERLDAQCRQRLSERLRLFMRYPFYRAVAQCIEKIDQTLHSDLSAAQPQQSRRIAVLEGYIISLLQFFDAHKAAAPRSIHRCAALLSVYVSFSKLLRNEKMRAFILSYIPTRNEQGRIVRDRKQQITHLVQADSRLQERHLQMIRKIYPIIIRQMMTLNSHYKLSTFNFIMAQEKLNARAYLQLISHMTHEIIHCGLGVIIGIPSSRTCIHTKKGSERIRALVT